MAAYDMVAVVEQDAARRREDLQGMVGEIDRFTVRRRRDAILAQAGGATYRQAAHPDGSVTILDYRYTGTEIITYVHAFADVSASDIHFRLRFPHPPAVLPVPRVDAIERIEGVGTLDLIYARDAADERRDVVTLFPWVMMLDPYPAVQWNSTRGPVTFHCTAYQTQRRDRIMDDYRRSQGVADANMYSFH